jgi:hypothetical protein
MLLMSQFPWMGVIWAQSRSSVSIQRQHFVKNSTASSSLGFSLSPPEPSISLP